MTQRKTPLPPIPAKRYFTIGEVAELCGVKPHVLRYWEQEFTQLRPMKRRGNRRYYQHHEVLLVRRIRELLYEQGFTINGARNRLGEAQQRARGEGGDDGDAAAAAVIDSPSDLAGPADVAGGSAPGGQAPEITADLRTLRADLQQALELLSGAPAQDAEDAD